MHRLIVNKFGPIRECNIPINDFTVLIGPQSSGKSTISKLVFFFLNIREEAIRFMRSNLDQKNKFDQEDFIKHIRTKFLEFWGPIPQDRELYIEYAYSDITSIKIELYSIRYKKLITPIFSTDIIDVLERSFDELKEVYSINPSGSLLFDSSTVLSIEEKRKDTLSEIRNRLNRLFAFDKEILFIPAGRSLLSTLSDQLQYIHPHLLDYPMRQFIERINTTKSFFNKSMDDIITEKQALSNSPISLPLVQKAQSIVKRILKGEYVHDKEGGKLYIGPGIYTKINYASSGQQESVWILLSLFLIALDKVNAFIFVEEPEAHLFPNAQKDLVELMCFLSCSLNSTFFITTHSPYILSAVNNHIYAHSIGQKHGSKVEKVIDKSTWLNPKKTGGFFVDSGILTNLIDDDLKLFKSELIDSASEIINREFDAIFDVEHGENE